MWVGEDREKIKAKRMEFLKALNIEENKIGKNPSSQLNL
jgi:hypothetical protein